MSETVQPQAAGEGSGERFGDYVLLQKIAQGGMAEVFLAKRRGVEGFEKTVAIKRILPELSWNREFVSMFINEAKIAARLSHPNIVQIFDFGKIDNYHFIAMEYVHGENLRTILQRAEQKKIPIAPEIAALIAARAAGLEHRKRYESAPLRIVHRDVSPQNVPGPTTATSSRRLRHAAAPRILRQTRGVLKGKLAYLSPEQVSGRNLDARSNTG
jgi:serine/threonine-protein kinase